MMTASGMPSEASADRIHPGRGYHELKWLTAFRSTAVFIFGLAAGKFMTVMDECLGKTCLAIFLAMTPDKSYIDLGCTVAWICDEWQMKCCGGWPSRPLGYWSSGVSVVIIFYQHASCNLHVWRHTGSQQSTWDCAAFRHSLVELSFFF